MRRFYITILSIGVYIYFTILLGLTYIMLLFPCDCLFDNNEDIEKDNI